MRRSVLFGWATILLLAGSRTSSAQVTELPEPFDSAGRVQVVTPALVARLKLVPPVWTVTGDYIEARLFRRSEGGHVIAVQRRNGAIDRYLLTPEESQRLRSAVSSAMLEAGRPTTEERGEVISESAKGAFIRDQTALAAAYYGPLLAALMTDDPSSATAIWLLTTGGTFFLTANLTKNTSVTRAQNFLSRDLAWRGSAMAWGLAYAMSGETATDDASLIQASLLTGAVGGAITGFKLGKPLTDGEVQSLALGSTSMMLTTAGVMGSVGLFDHVSGQEGRVIAATLVGAGIAGMPMGLRYPRTAHHSVTAGDVQVIGLWSMLGAAAGLSASLMGVEGSSDPNGKAVSALTTLGYITGLAVGRGRNARLFDHTEGDARLLGVGALAGGLMGGAIDVLIKPTDAGVAVALPTLGAILGAIATEGLAAPPPDSRGALSMRLGHAKHSRRAPDGRRSPTLSISPTGAVFAAAGARGRFPIMSVQF